MPTYVLSTAKHLTAEQRAKIVESVTSIHHVEAKAPRFFVQVIFYKVETGSLFRGGEAASADDIWVRADIRSGRTKEQKANILHRIMQETSEILQISEENVWVYISDIPADNIAELGAILPQPGGEEEWLAKLPSALRKKLLSAP
ncbi:tautomerase family protein [Mesorhizobium sophorae]|uniref:tautomerase family protein n=1 Tax=Mesorhizobium sophorae TaxID=1300294 RepID=UPI000BA4CC78|nr:tautomerase family protein [Mesorhizobium sophorae]